MQNYISGNLRYLRKTKKISQGELCDSVNVTSATISNWERGKSEPTASQLIMLSKLFEVSISNLIGTDLSELPEPSPETKEPIILDEINHDDVAKAEPETVMIGQISDGQDISFMVTVSLIKKK